MSKYVIGIDFGTLSGRAVLADAADGRIIACAERAYAHGVMDRLEGGKPLGADWALQDPQDYLDVLEDVVPQVMRLSGAAPEDVIGIGSDFTCSTVMPLDRNRKPLCMKAAYRQEPHAYAKLWKHHAAQEQASRMTETALARKEAWLPVCGGRVSSEWSMPKLWQVLCEAPEIYQAMDAWMEAGDWLVGQICGAYVQSLCFAGYKSMYSRREGFPGEAYFAALDERLRHVIREKCAQPVAALGTRAGYLTEEMAARLGLTTRTAVSVSMADGHVGVYACGLLRPGQMVMIMGTSAAYLALGESYTDIEGICGVVEDGLMPGFWGYEAGQSCMGDLYAWMAERFVPAAYEMEAAMRGISVQALLTERAAALRPGESGLLALDWWNGNRSVLDDAELSGMLLGMTLRTTPEEIYRALIEATAYGTRMIMETYRAHGLSVDELLATGGISMKNELVMQIYADVLNMEIRVVDCEHGPALGSAIMGASAAGAQAGGYDGLPQAVRAMHAPVKKTYRPDRDRAGVYDLLYAQYAQLHDEFGRGGNDVMKTLRRIRRPQTD